MFEVVIRNHSPIKWEWQLHDHDGNVMLRGLEKTRAAAKYQGAAYSPDATSAL